MDKVLPLTAEEEADMREAIKRCDETFAYGTGNAASFGRVRSYDIELLCEFAEQSLNASTHQPPAGFVLVPVEPTEAMIEAAVRPYIGGLSENVCQMMRDCVRDYYRAMLAALLKG